MAPLKVYVASITANPEIRKRVQRTLMLLDGLGIPFDSIDIAKPGNEEHRIFMRENAQMKEGDRGAPMPPQFFHNEDYLGNYTDFEEAVENERYTEFLRLVPNSKPPPVEEKKEEKEEKSKSKDGKANDDKKKIDPKEVKADKGEGEDEEEEEEEEGEGEGEEEEEEEEGEGEDEEWEEEEEGEDEEEPKAEAVLKLPSSKTDAKVSEKKPEEPKKPVEEPKKLVEEPKKTEEDEEEEDEEEEYEEEDEAEAEGEDEEWEEEEEAEE